jgi:hypothetical protein
MVFFGTNPVYNTILFYILFVTIILVLKPRNIYCHKTKRFKSFGCGKEQTLLSFPIICISTVIVLYFIFLMVEIVSGYLDNPNK